MDAVESVVSRFATQLSDELDDDRWTFAADLDVQNAPSMCVADIIPWADAG